MYFNFFLGPPTDHFGDPYGFYLMAYGSLGMHENAQAIVKSSIFPGFDSDQCFHFHWSLNVIRSALKSEKSAICERYHHNFA